MRKPHKAYAFPCGVRFVVGLEKKQQINTKANFNCAISNAKKHKWYIS